jgi:Tol biopolymer transport system component
MEVIGQPQQGLQWPVVSPDNARAAALTTEKGLVQIWIHELARGTRRRFSDKGVGWIAAWVSDDRLAYNSGGKTYMRSVTGSDPPELLVEDDTLTISTDRRYAATERRVGESLDIYYFDLQEGGEALPLLISDATESQPAIRPGGGWLAYVSNETGRDEVYVVRLPSGKGKWQVSVDGGTAPHWSRKGDEMFFQTNWGDGADIMFVGVTTEPEWQLTEPKRLFGGADATINIGRGWSVSSDGQRILGVRAVMSESDTRRINVVENWYREFEKP